MRKCPHLVASGEDLSMLLSQEEIDMKTEDPAHRSRRSQNLHSGRFDSGHCVQ